MAKKKIVKQETVEGDVETGKGLGDIVEDVIKAVAPKIAKKNENCLGCKKRKRFLNNFNGIFK